ncbi:MAG: hypothetical protein V1775_10565 [Bacteroidota bacterium]
MDVDYKDEKQRQELWISVEWVNGLSYHERVAGCSLGKNTSAPSCSEINWKLGGFVPMNWYVMPLNDIPC